jgi:hypothetical protein
MYSLVNVATLVRDLARSPRAATVATELLRAFALDADALWSLDAVEVASAQADRRAQVLASDLASPRALTVLAAARGFAETLGIDAYSAAVDVLETAPLGGGEDLQAFVRHDVLADAWEAAGDVAVTRWPRALDVVADGVLGAFAGDDALAEPWRRWTTRHGLRPARSDWPHVVARVRALSPDADVPPAPAAWATRMHDACWAVHLTGRERAATITHLHALLALTEVYAPEVPPLRAVSMTTAAVHAAVVADVLDAGTCAAMSEPFLRLLP